MGGHGVSALRPENESTTPDARGTFGSDPHSREELVAEMGAAFLCGHCDIANQTIAQSAAYIQHWLERLKADRKLVVQAAAQARVRIDRTDCQRREPPGRRRSGNGIVPD